ncbi:MAG: rRNA maturation RNase YbeY [Bacteroidota bacterium]
MEILFFTEKVDFKVENPALLREWITKVVQDHYLEVGEVSFVFTTDEYLLKINREFLNHDYLTDIITFDNRQGKELNSDIYISLDRVKENADDNNKSLLDELHRVIIHGILHLCGYNDNTEESKTKMRNAEDKYLSLLADL